MTHPSSLSDQVVIKKIFKSLIQGQCAKGSMQCMMRAVLEKISRVSQANVEVDVTDTEYTHFFIRKVVLE